MFDTMIGELAAAYQLERQREMAREAQIAAAQRANGPRAVISRSQRQRTAIASALRALAFRLAPPQEGPTAAMYHAAGAQP
jgi:hypothetical protein